MAHWLNPIVDLFTCETHDLAELARVVGYEPQEFYRGTLSPDDIDRLVLRKNETVIEEVVVVTGNLGIAEAVCPNTIDFVAIEAPARVFASEVALQEAYLRGELTKPSALVIRLSDREGVWLDDLQFLTPVPELLKASGIDCVLLIDATVSELTGNALVVTNFSESTNVGGAIGAVRHDQIVRLDITRRTLEADSTPGLKSPYERSSPTRSVTSNAIAQISADNAEDTFDRVLREQIRYLKLIVERLATRPAKVVVDCFLRMFRNICIELTDVLKVFEDELEAIRSAQMLLHLEGVGDLVGQVSQKAHSMRAREIAQTGYETKLVVISTIRRSSAFENYAEEAHALRILGELYSRSGDAHRAIHVMEVALERLDAVLVRHPDPSVRLTYLSISKQLSGQLIKVKDLDGAATVMRSAQLVFGTEYRNLAPDAAGVVGSFFMAWALLESSLGHQQEALDHFDAALDVYLILASNETGMTLIETIAKIYRRRSAALRDIGDPNWLLEALSSLILRSHVVVHLPTSRRQAIFAQEWEELREILHIFSILPLSRDEDQLRTVFARHMPPLARDDIDGMVSAVTELKDSLLYRLPANVRALSEALGSTSLTI